LSTLAGTRQHYESRNLGAGNYEIKVEFADTLARPKLSAWWRGPGFDLPQEAQDPNCWFVQYWGNDELWWIRPRA